MRISNKEKGTLYPKIATQVSKMLKEHKEPVKMYGILENVNKNLNMDLSKGQLSNVIKWTREECGRNGYNMKWFFVASPKGFWMPSTTEELCDWCIKTRKDCDSRLRTESYAESYLAGKYGIYIDEILEQGNYEIEKNEETGAISARVTEEETDYEED